MSDMRMLIHEARVLLPSGKHEVMYYVQPSDAEKLLQEIERLRADNAALQAIVDEQVRELYLLEGMLASLLRDKHKLMIRLQAAEKAGTD